MQYWERRVQNNNAK